MASGQDAELGSGKGLAGIPSRRRLLRLEPIEVRLQIGAALLHLVAQLATGKSGEGGIAELSPRGAQPFLQGSDIAISDIAIEDLGLVHSAKTPKRDGASSRSDSRANAYSDKRRNPAFR
jgi:hypothetical protein